MVEGPNTSFCQRLGDQDSRALRSSQRVFDTHPAMVPLRHRQAGPTPGQQRSGFSRRRYSAFPTSPLLPPPPSAMSRV